MGRNQLPAHYAAINENNLPAELFPQYCTLEYQVSEGERERGSGSRWGSFPHIHPSANSTP